MLSSARGDSANRLPLGLVYLAAVVLLSAFPAYGDDWARLTLSDQASATNQAQDSVPPAPPSDSPSASLPVSKPATQQPGPKQAPSPTQPSDPSQPPAPHPGRPNREHRLACRSRSRDRWHRPRPDCNRRIRSRRPASVPIRWPFHRT